MYTLALATASAWARGRLPRAGSTSRWPSGRPRWADDMVVDEKERFLFERMSVPKAVMTLAVPTIVSQVVTMV